MEEKQLANHKFYILVKNTKDGPFLIINRKTLEYKIIIKDNYLYVNDAWTKTDGYEKLIGKIELETDNSDEAQTVFDRWGKEFMKEKMLIEEEKPMPKKERELPDWQQSLLDEYKELQKEFQEAQKRTYKYANFLFHHTDDGYVSTLEWHLLSEYINCKNAKTKAMRDEIRALGHRLDLYKIEH